MDIEIKSVKFEDSLFENCYFEDVRSTNTYFENCTIKNTVFYNTGRYYICAWIPHKSIHLSLIQAP